LTELTPPELTPPGLTLSGGALLCLDPGDVRIGIAVRNAGTSVALGRPAVLAGPKAIAALREISEELDVEAIIVGLPLHLRGTRGPAVDKALDLARQVRQACDRRVFLVDERLSSVQAQQQLRAAGRNARRARGEIDSASAIIVLQSYLDGIDAIALEEFDLGTV